MKLGDVSIAYIDIMVKAANQLEQNISPLLQQFNIQAESLLSPDARLSIPKFMRLGHAVILQSNAPWFGLEMGKVTCAPHLGLAGLMAFCAPTIKQACAFITDYEPLNSVNVRGQSLFYIQNGTAVAQFYSISPYNHYNYFVVDSVLSGWYKLVKEFTGQNNLIDYVSIEFEQPFYYSKYADYFDCEVRFSQSFNGLVFKEKREDTPCINSCHSTMSYLQRQADNAMQEITSGLSFQQRVAHVISPLLSGVTPTLAQVAQQLNIPPWTVRRKLLAESSSFQSTLNDTRCQLAKSYVCDTDISLGEIAYLLGFSSPAAFQHAFKRWVGVAPGTFRNRHKET